MPVPLTYENIRTVPLAVNFNYRRDRYQADSYVLNGFLEKEADGADVVKRPGLKVIMDFVAQTGYNAVSWLGALASYGVQGVATYSQDQFGLVIAGRVFAAVGGALAPITLVEFTAPTIPPTEKLRGLLDNVNRMAWQGSSAIYTVNGVNVVANPSAHLLVPSLCQLNQTYYVMDVVGTIWASAIGNILSWPALNTVVAFTDFQAVTLVRHQQYLLAFTTQGLKAYYDAGISPGAPIAQETSFVCEVGVPWSAAGTVQTLENVMYWLGHSTTDGYQVYQLAGLQLSQVSTPEIARYIKDKFVPFMVNEYGNPLQGSTLQGMRATAVQVGGHSYYIITCPTKTYNGSFVGSSIVYDITVGAWYLWSQLSAGVQAELRIGANVGETVVSSNLMFDPTNGKAYAFDMDTFQDAGQPITFEVQTPLCSWGNHRTKIIAATYVASDTFSSSYQLSWTDDDYQTYTAPVTISSATPKKRVIRCGSTSERAWKITHTDNTPMRLFSLEVESLPGAL